MVTFASRTNRTTGGTPSISKPVAVAFALPPRTAFRSERTATVRDLIPPGVHRSRKASGNR